MRFWNILKVVSLVLASILTLCGSQAGAASDAQYLGGTNLWGRAGLLLGDSADVLGVGKLEGSLNLTYQLLESQPTGVGAYYKTHYELQVPVGIHVGLMDDVEVYGGANIQSMKWGSDQPNFLGATSSDIVYFNAGGKVHFTANNPNVNFSFGTDVSLSSFGTNWLLTPRGTCSILLGNGWILNGSAAVALLGPTVYFIGDGGIGVPFGDGVLWMTEAGSNQLGYGGSYIGEGIRVGMGNVKLQGLVGIPLNWDTDGVRTSGVIVGGGIILSSR